MSNLNGTTVRADTLTVDRMAGLPPAVRKKTPKIIKYAPYFVLMAPALLYFLIFKYVPMFGIVVAFQNFKPFLGFWGSPWVGFGQFATLFNTPLFWQNFWNTLIISLLKLAFGFPAPVILALLLNELRSNRFKRVIQSVSYLPHFLSWMVLGGIIMLIFDGNTGIVPQTLDAIGFGRAQFLTDPHLFRTLIVGTSVWKEVGWGTVVYLAAITGINPELYEAATIDGAGRFKQMWYVTLPMMKSVIVVLLILRLGSIMDVGFQQILVLYNPNVYSVGDVLDTYVYRVGLTGTLQVSFATAAGLFKSIIGLVLVYGANKLAGAMGEYGIW